MQQCQTIKLKTFGDTIAHYKSINIDYTLSGWFGVHNVQKQLFDFRYVQRTPQQCFPTLCVAEAVVAIADCRLISRSYFKICQHYFHQDLTK